MSCTCEKKSFQDAYNDEMQSTLVLMGLDKPNTEARILVAQTLRPRFAFDRQTAVREAENLQEYEVPEASFTITSDGHVLYTQYGRTLIELHERQLRLQPDQYSKTEHEISRSIEHAFQQGATEVVTSYPREGQDNRDLIVMRWDPTTNKGTTSVINTQVDGKNHAYEYVHTIAIDQFPHLQERDVAIRMGFVLSNEEPEIEIYKGSFFEKSFVKSHSASLFQREIIGNEMYRSVGQVQEAVVNNIADTIHGISRHIQIKKQHKQKEKPPLFFRRLFQLIVAKKEKNTEENSNSYRDQNRMETQKPRYKKQELSVVIPRKKDQKKFARLRKTRKFKFEQQQTKLHHAKDNVEQSILLIKTDISHKKIKIRRVHSEMREKGQEKPLLIETKGKYKRRLTHCFIEQSRKQKAYKKRIRCLFIHAAALVKIFEKEKIRKKQVFSYEKQSDIQLKKKRLIRSFIHNEINKQVITYIINILLSLTLFEFLYKKNESDRYMHAQKNKKNIRIKQRYNIECKDCNSPWLLLSIIWYLVMLKEQGKPTVIRKKKQQKSQKKRSGIIFQYIPGKIMPTQAIFMI